MNRMVGASLEIQAESVSDTQPAVFVVGVGRSGTSLVQSMLASHSWLAFPPETAFLRRLVIRGDLHKALSVGQPNVMSLLDEDARLIRCGLDGRAICDRRAEYAQTGSVWFYCAFVQLFRERAGKKGVGDKDPRMVEFLPVVSAALPGVHVVHVIRDPRDVLLSKKKAAWSSRHGVIRHVFTSRVQFRIGRLEGRQLPSNTYHELIYERLLKAPEDELQALCTAMQLPFEDAMLDFGTSASRLVSRDEMQWKKETLGPLLRANQGKWKGVLSGWESALTELVCDEQFKSGGYERSHRLRRLPLKQRLAVYGAACLIMTADPLYRLYRKWTVWRSRKYF